MIYTFKTNVNCGGCVRAITPALNTATVVKSWTVDTTHQDKLLRVETDAPVADIIAIIEDAGFKIEIC